MKGFYALGDISKLEKQSALFSEFLKHYICSKFERVGHGPPFREIKPLTKNDTVSQIWFLETLIESVDSEISVADGNFRTRLEFEECLAYLDQSIDLIKDGENPCNVFEGDSAPEGYDPKIHGLEAAREYYIAGMDDDDLSAGLLIPMNWNDMYQVYKDGKIPSIPNFDMADPDVLMFSCIFHEKNMIPVHDKTSIALSKLARISASPSYAHWFVHGSIAALSSNPNAFGLKTAQQNIKAAIIGEINLMYGNSVSSHHLSGRPIMSPSSPKFADELAMLSIAIKAIY